MMGAHIFKEFMPGFLSFEGGKYDSLEGRNQGFSHGFVITFKDKSSRDDYLIHPAHIKIAGELKEAITEFPGGIIAFDFSC